MLKAKQQILFYTLLLGIFSYILAEGEDYNKAVQFYQQAKFDSTIYYSQKVPPADTLYFYAQLLIGHAQLELDSLKQAKKTFESLIQYSKKRHYVYNGIGLYHLYKHNKNKAIIRFLKKLGGVDDQEKAKSLFQRAMKLNPNYLDAQINYNRALMVSEDEKQFLIAVNNLEKLALIYPDNPDVHYYFGMAKLKLKDEPGAVEVFLNILKKHPFHSMSSMSLAFAYFDQENYKLFSYYYMRGCTSLYNQKWIRRLFIDITDIISKKEKNSAKAKILTGNFFIKFWQSRDPIPSTDENERLIEHYKRLDYARSHYPGGTITGYDDRGKIYVRFGKPDDYYRSISSDGFILDNESWVYQIGDNTYNYDFVKKGINFELVNDLSLALTNPVFNFAHTHLQDIYLKRSHLSNYYSNIYNSLLNYKPRGVTGSLTELKTELNQYAAKEKVKKTDMPLSIYDVNLEGTDLTFDFDSFKYFDTAKSRWFLNIIYGLDLKQIPFRFRDNQYFGELSQNLTLFQSDRSGSKKKVDKKISFVSRNKIFDKYFLNKVSTSLFPGKNIVFFQLKNEADNKFRIVESSVSSSYLIDKFAISDLLLSDDIKPRSSQDDTLFCRNGYYINPVPARNFDRYNPIYCYFELYNINLDADNEGRGLVEYVIKEHQTARNLSALLKVINPFKSKSSSQSMVALVNEIEFSKRHEPVILAFDVSQLQSGTYEFIVRVKYLNSREQITTKKMLQLY